MCTTWTAKSQIFLLQGAIEMELSIHQQNAQIREALQVATVQQGKFSEYYFFQKCEYESEVPIYWKSRVNGSRVIGLVYVASLSTIQPVLLSVKTVHTFRTLIFPQLMDLQVQFHGQLPNALQVRLIVYVIILKILRFLPR